MFKFLGCGCFNTEHMEPNQAIFSQIAKQQQAWKKKTGISYSSGCCRGRTWLSSSNLVCQAPAPNPFLCSYFSLNAHESSEDAWIVRGLFLIMRKNTVDDQESDDWAMGSWAQD